MTELTGKEVCQETCHSKSHSEPLTHEKAGYLARPGGRAFLIGAGAGRRARLGGSCHAAFGGSDSGFGHFRIQQCSGTALDYR